MKNIALHIPHDGHEIPYELQNFITIPNEKFMYYDKMMSDIHLNKIVKGLPHKIFSCPYSRLICDVERFLQNETMEKYGMGFCYSKTFDGLEFKTVTNEVLNITKKYYQKHHDDLNLFAKYITEPTLLIDFHSFNIKATLPELLDDTEPAPDICIGYDNKYCSEEIKDLLKKVAEEFQYSVKINYPYSGTLVPQNVLNGLNVPLQSIMIEINRNCYAEADGQMINKGCQKLRNMLKKFINECIKS